MKMKIVFSVMIALVLSVAVQAQTNTGILQIQVDVNKLTGECNLSAADTVYMHSGLGWSNPDSIWQTVVGDWGIDDGKGEMTETAPGSKIWSICFNVVDYYTYEADPDSTHVNGVGDGPMPAGATPYNIGVVFRTAFCPISSTTHKPQCSDPQDGKDENCENIYIIGINNPKTMSVTDDAGLPFAAVTAKYIDSCTGLYATLGVQDLNPSFGSVSIFPTPFTNALYIQFRDFYGTKPKVAIYDLVGDIVADLSSRVTTGSNSIVWNGKSSSGAPVPAGFYLVQISNGEQTYTGKVIKQ